VVIVYKCYYILSRIASIVAFSTKFVGKFGLDWQFDTIIQSNSVCGNKKFRELELIHFLDIYFVRDNQVAGWL